MVDFYWYQIITGENVTNNIDFNTTDNVVVLSELPHDVEILFTISAYNCGRASTQVTLVISGKQTTLFICLHDVQTLF